MEKDLAHIFLGNLIYFWAGLLMFFLLTMFKVHMLWYIQPKLFNPEPEKLFKNYFSNFINILLSKKKIIAPTFEYLFAYKQEKFKLLENIKGADIVGLRYNILNAITNTMKPILVFAFLWLILKSFIEYQLFYDPLKITLGEIQKKILILQKLAFFVFLQKNKAAVFLVYGILCILIPVVYANIKKFSNLKKIITNSLLYLTLLGSISFFGTSAGKFPGGKIKELSELKAEIINIHDSIFTKAASGIIEDDYLYQLTKSDSIYSAESKKLDSVENSLLKNITSDSILSKAKYRLENFTSDVRNYYSVSRSFTVEQAYFKMPVSIKNDEAFNAGFFTGDFSKNTAEKDDYIFNPNKWNKESGVEYIKFFKQQSARPESKIHKIIELVVHHILDHTITEFFEISNLKEHKILKKLVSLITIEAYKKKLVEKISSLFDELKNNKKIVTTEEKINTETFTDRNELEKIVKVGEANISNIILEAIREEKIAKQTEYLQKITAEKIEKEKKLEEAKIAEDKRIGDLKIAKELETRNRANLKRIANLNKWENLRQRMLREINNIECPFIVRSKEEFKMALENWEGYAFQNADQIKTSADLESKFWEYARYKPTLIEAFARGVMWYSNDVVSGTSTIRDALDFYGEKNIPNDIYENFAEKFGSGHACKSLFN